MNRPALSGDLERDESRRLKPYLDCCGKPWRQCRCKKKGRLSIGVGRNLDDVGLSDAEVDLLLLNDESAVLADLATFPWFAGLNDVRQRAIANFRFNVGPGTFRDFMPTWALVAAGDFNGAAAHLTNSPWFRQVGARGRRIVQMVQTGVE